MTTAPQKTESRTRFVDENYPFDPNAKIELLTDLDKLRAIADRELAADLAAVFGAIVSRPVAVSRGGQLTMFLDVQ